MKFIVKKDANDGKVLDIWQTARECAKDLDVTEPAISIALKNSGKCKGFLIERMELNKDDVLKLAQA